MFKWYLLSNLRNFHKANKKFKVKSSSGPYWTCTTFFLFSVYSPSTPASWGEKMRASPQGEVLMYRWNWTFSFSLKPRLSSHLLKMDFCCSSSWLLETQMWNQVTLYHTEFYGKLLIGWQGAFKLFIKMTHTVLVKVWHAGEITCVAWWCLFYWIQDIWILQVFKLTC